MNKYDYNIKKTLLAELKKGISVIELSNRYDISRNTIYRWKKESESRVLSSIEKDKEIEWLNRQVEWLKEIIQVINEANCLPSAPLKEKLFALESIYGNHSVRILCEALDVDRGTFYNHILRNKKTNTWYAKQRELLRVAIQKAYDDYGQIFGSGKITSILKEQGYKTCEDTVRRFMSDMGLTSIRQQAKAMYEKERKAYYKNKVNQNFTANGPNEIWVSDVTCYSFQEKNYYICVILDLFSRMVVGYRISHRNSTQLAKGTFKMASHTFMSYLKSFSVVQSFSRAHIPYDNSVVESFFANFKREELYRRKYKSERELFTTIDDYIDFYNNKRPHSTNNYKTPASKEQNYKPKQSK